MEYQVAQQEMLKLRHRIIPIMLEDVSHMENLDENLQFILKSVTYVEWPGASNPQKQHAFWKKIRKALPKEGIKAEECAMLKSESFDKERTVSMSTCQTQLSVTEEENTVANEFSTRITSI